jgi:choice-of-anchor B domain-containing protein
MKRLLFFVLFLPFLASAQSSMNMNLLGTYDYPTTQGNDIWGWVDASGNEYALVGLRSGFSVVNVTNASSPTEEFFISDVNSTWRDVKTWGNYAYVTTEANAGLLIVDLTDMTGNTYSHVTQFTNNNGGSVSFTSAHDIYIDENGIAYIFGAGGSGPQSNGAIFLDVDANPTNPVYLGEWSDEYIHDGMVRGDTMYAGCIYAGKVFIVDVSNKTNPTTLGSAITPNAFTHNAWVSDDGNYVFTTDEQSDAYLGAFDISNLSNIQEVDRIQSNPGSNSIPHNTFVDGNFLITSYYRDGTTVHDITYPNYMIQVAYYDSYSGSGNGFDGCWGTYPYLPSGNIISSDINSGAGGHGRLLIYGRNFQQACYLQGNIYDGLTGLPIANANMEILTTTTSETSNLLGYYQSALVNSGTYQLVFSAAGYISDTITVLFANGVMTIQDAFLYPPCNTLNIETNQNASICDNTIYIVGNSVYTTSGSYTDTLQTTYGCDSIVNTNLIVSASIAISNYDTICDGQSIIVGVNLYNQSGVYTDILTSSAACDSTITTYLFVKMNTNFTQTISICPNGGVQVGANYYNQNGTYVDVFPSQNGCDSTITTTVIVLPDVTYNQSLSICHGESASVGQSVYTSAGIYTDVLTANNGCDSTVFTTILVFPAYSATNIINLCGVDSVMVGNNIYTTTGIYYDSLLTTSLCDSVIITDLIISDPVGSIMANGIQLNVGANGGVQPYIYEVFGPNGLILSSNNNNGGVLIINPTLNGQYYFIATDALGCVTDTVFFTVDFATTAIDESSSMRKLVKITDVLGRESMPQANVPLFYRYDDGKVEKRIIIE